MKVMNVLCCAGLAATIACGGSNDSKDTGSSGDAGTGTDAGTQAKTFTLTLSPANETPRCAGAAAGATGTATVTIAADDSSIGVALAFSGLSGPPTAGHIHSGTAAAAGPVVLPFTGLSSPYSATFTAANYVAAANAPPDFASFVAALRNGGAGYVNVHTAACPGGEIRAEIE